MRRRRSVLRSIRILRASARTDLNLAVLLFAALAERMSLDPESPSDPVYPGTTTENGDLERDEGDDRVESDDPDDDAADDRNGVHPADTDVERDVAEDEGGDGDGRDCRRRRFAWLGTVSRRVCFLGGLRTGDTLRTRTQLPTMSSHSHSPAFAVPM